MKKIFTILFAVVALSVTAFAESIETEASLQWMLVPYNSNGSALNWDIRPIHQCPIPRMNDQTNVDTIALGPYNVPTMTRANFRFLNFSVSVPEGIYGKVKYYMSAYFAIQESEATEHGEWFNAVPSTVDCVVTDGNGQILTYTANVTQFSPDSSLYPVHSHGFAFEFEIDVPENTPLIDIAFQPSIDRTFFEVDTPYKINENLYHIVVPSASLIANRKSDELQQLENIADAIVEQNEVSKEYYADIIAKVDDLYTEVGNLADLQQEAIEQFDNWNIVTDVPSSVTDKTDKAEDVLEEIESLEKPDPEEIVPDLEVDTEDIGEVIAPFFQNALIIQVVTMTLSFAFISYVLFGKKG